MFIGSYFIYFFFISPLKANTMNITRRDTFMQSRLLKNTTMRKWGQCGHEEQSGQAPVIAKTKNGKKLILPTAAINSNTN